MKKNILRLSALLFSLILIASCTDNEVKYMAQLPKTGDFKLKSSSDSIILRDTMASTHTAIAFNWDSLVYKVSTPVTFTLQMDTANGNFANPLEEDIPLNTYKTAYTDSIFNKKMQNLLKLKPNIASHVQVRVKANLAFGNLPVFSNTLNLSVTPYKIAKIVSYLYMPGPLSGGWNNFTNKLCSRNNDGNYEGYIKANQWDNFKFTTKADYTGSTYGSKPNSLYTLDAASDQWNIWFDAAGYFLIKADLNNMNWNKTAINSFCVTGDFNNWSLTANPMTYDTVNKVWTASCTISTIGYGFQIIGNGDWGFKYGDNDGGKDAGELTFGGANIKPTSTGTKTITMDLSNPAQYTYKIQ